MPTQRPPSLATASVFVALRVGALSVLAIATLGSLSFFAVPAATRDLLRTRDAVFDFLLSLGLISTFFLGVAAVVAWLSGKSAAGDVRFVTRRITAIAKRGDLGEPVAIRTLDEVGELTRALESLRRAFVEQLVREREARHQAQEADRAKSEFLTTVSHELRTPLNAILGFTQVLLAELEGSITTGQREDLRMIQASGEHLQQLFDNVLDLSTIVSGRIDLKKQPVQIGPVLEEVAALLEGQRFGKPVAIMCHVDDFLPDVEADPVRLKRIVMNLATNALSFTERGEVALTASVRDGWLIVRVRDTGSGIAPEELEHVFDEFTQVGAKSRRRAGTGLGLSICKQLAELHGGRIEVESRPGLGSTFGLWLPVSEPTQSGEQP